MSDSSEWFDQTKSQATILSEAYRLRLSGLWWLNLVFVVMPAVLSTSAAIFAALPPGKGFVVFSLPAASALAGAAVVLMAVHKSLKCDEYQAECLRLSQAYQSIAISVNSALNGPEELRYSHQERLTNKLEMLVEGARAQLPTKNIRQAEEITGEKLYVLPVA